MLGKMDDAVSSLKIKPKYSPSLPPPPPPKKNKMLKRETVLVKTGIFYIAFLFQLNTVMRGLFML